MNCEVTALRYNESASSADSHGHLRDNQEAKIDSIAFG